MSLCIALRIMFICAPIHVFLLSLRFYVSVLFDHSTETRLVKIESCASEWNICLSKKSCFVFYLLNRLHPPQPPPPPPFPHTHTFCVVFVLVLLLFFCFVFFWFCLLDCLFVYLFYNNKTNNERTERRSLRFVYNLLTASRTVSNTHAVVVPAQSRNHQSKSRAARRALFTCNMSCATWYGGTAELFISY